MKLSKVLLGLTGCFFAASLSGCFVVASDRDDDGSVTVALSLDNSSSPSQCDYFKVDHFHVDLDDGATVISADGNCGDLGTTIDNVLSGTYTVNVSLFEGSTPASNVFSVDNILVSRNTDTLVKVDIPANYIYK